MFRVSPESRQFSSILGLDYHVNRILTFRPVFIAHCAARQISAQIRCHPPSKQVQEVFHRIQSAEVVKVIMAVHFPAIDRQLLQRRIEVVPQFLLILGQLRSRGELSVERIAVPGFITDDSRFLIVRQMVLLFEVVPLLIADVRILRGGLVVGRFFLTIVITLAYTINRRLSIALSAFGGGGHGGM